MFDKYSYKIKFKVLLVLAVLLGIVAYKRSFSSLVAVVGEYRVLADKMEKIEQNVKGIDALTFELTSLNKVIGSGSVNKEKIQQDIINFISTRDVNISIFDLKSIHTFHDQNHVVYTNQLDVTGNLNKLLSLSYDFEKEFNLSRIVSMKFYTSKKNNKPDVLHLKMIFQNYENIK